MSKRPEHTAPPEIFYDSTEARKYTSNSRMMNVQQELSERALELLALPEDTPALLLDIGCGSGLSGECLTESGHVWFGMDISRAMLDVAVEREVDGDLMEADVGFGIPFRAGTFDGVLSISALQWLCNADKRWHRPPARLYQLFRTLYAAMRRGARAVFQIYPENSAQIELITQQSMKAGFTGGLVVDFPNSTKAKKMYLCLFTGGGGGQELPRALGTEAGGSQRAVEFTATQRQQRRDIRGKPPKKSKDWIQEKKERRRKQGKEVREDSKYTGRRRNNIRF